MNFAEYVAAANENLAIVLQIEHIDAVNDIGAILQTPGVAALFVGPFDLSGSMGMIGQINAPEVQAAITGSCDACRNADMPLGLYVWTGSRGGRRSTRVQDDRAGDGCLVPAEGQPKRALAACR